MASRSSELRRRTLLVAHEERPPLGGVEIEIRLEAPGVEAYGDVVGERVVAGEVKVDQTRKLLADEEDVVGKEVGVDDALWQSIGPGRFEELASSVLIRSLSPGMMSSAREANSSKSGRQP